MKQNLIERALNLFFPQCCGFCGELVDSYLCEYCRNYLSEKAKSRVDIYTDKFFSSHFWLFEYCDEIRERIIDYKFNDKSYLCRTFAQIILGNEKACEYIQSFDVLIPIPIHDRRNLIRGYNQCELIARFIAREINDIEMRTDIIRKKENIRAQSLLSKEERLENVKGVYEICGAAHELEGKKVLLLDDVFTTGSTMNECARVLSFCNCERVGGITLARD